MADKKVINTTDLLREVPKSEAEIQADLDAVAKRISEDEMVDVFIPEAYRGAFGTPLRFSVNAVTVEIPIGKTVKVSKAHAAHAQRLMKGAVISKNQNRPKPEEVYND